MPSAMNMNSPTPYPPPSSSNNNRHSPTRRHSPTPPTRSPAPARLSPTRGHSPARSPARHIHMHGHSLYSPIRLARSNSGIPNSNSNINNNAINSNANATTSTTTINTSRSSPPPIPPPLPTNNSNNKSHNSHYSNNKSHNHSPLRDAIPLEADSEDESESDSDNESVLLNNHDDDVVVRATLTSSAGGSNCLSNNNDIINEGMLPKSNQRNATSTTATTTTTTTTNKTTNNNTNNNNNNNEPLSLLLNTKSSSHESHHSTTSTSSNTAASRAMFMAANPGNNNKQKQKHNNNPILPLSPITTIKLTQAAVEELNKSHSHRSQRSQSAANNNSMGRMDSSGSGSSSNNKWRQRDINVRTTSPSTVSFSPTNPNANANSTTANNNNNTNNNINTSKQHKQGMSYTYTSCNSIPITPLHQIPYVHGGYAAAAPLFITNSKFASILKRLLPGAYGELQSLLANYGCRHDTGGGANAGGGGGGVGGEKTPPKYTRNTTAGTTTTTTINDLVMNADSISGMTPPPSTKQQEQTSNNNSSSSSFRKEKRLRNLPISSCSSPTYYQDGMMTTDPSNSNSSSGNATTGNGNGGGGGVGDVVLMDPVKVMKWAENNPVVSAFGIWNSDSGRRTIKFMNGIRQNNNGGSSSDEHNGTGNSSTNDYLNNNNDRAESVITLGSNTHNGYAGSFAGGGGGGYRQTKTNATNNHHGSGGLPYVQRSRRRKQPLPEDEPNYNYNYNNITTTGDNHSMIDGSITGGGIGVGGISSRNLYGMEVTPQQRQLQPSYSKPALEWDVFLDPNLVRLVDTAMTVVDNLELKLRKARIKREKKRVAAARLQNKRTQHYQYGKLLPNNNQRSVSSGSNNSNNNNNNKEDDRNDDEEEDDDDDFDILQAHTAAQVEVDRLVSQLMRRTIIAHGSMSQLVLEAMGVAPKYNFGTVVKSSRDGASASTMRGSSRASSSNNPSSPSRATRVSLRAGNTEFSLNVTQTMPSWDEEEEQRDFEALLDPTVLSSAAREYNQNGNGGTAEGGGGGGRSKRKNSVGSLRRIAGGVGPSTSLGSSAAGSKGMFMETWIHVFARTLTLLVKSNQSKTSPTNNGDIVKKGSSSSTKGSQDSNGNRGVNGLLSVKNRPAKIGERGLSGLLEKMFLRRDSSFPEVPTENHEGSSTVGVRGGDGMYECVDEDDEMRRIRNQTQLDFDDDENSELLTNNDMFASPSTPRSSTFGGLCGISLCLGYEGGSNNNSSNSTSTFPLNPHGSNEMAQDVDRISSILGEPLRLVLDLKSRRVPPRVWSRLIDSLRTRGLVIEGIGSFDVDELRVIGKGCSYPLTPILFFHSVGDLQRACHANEVKNGDTVYFNGGSLMWKRSSIMEVAQRGCCGGIEHVGGVDDNVLIDGVTAGGRSTPKAGGGNGNYSFQPYAYPRSALSDWERVMCKSTIEDYRRHFNLKIGVYVQEFSISAEALDALSIFVNKHGDVYDQGLAFGGVNGTAVKNIHGDGYWNQRYMGRSWDFDAKPSKEMTPLKPEDHHLVQKAIQAGAWGQVGTIYEVMDEKAGALTVATAPPPRETCNMVNTF